MARLLPIVFFALILLLPAGCERKPREKVVIKFSSVIPPTNPIMDTYNYLAEEIAEKSHGEIVLKIYDSGRLGGETDNLERLLLGTMEMADMATSILGNLVDDFYVFDLPFLFNDANHQYNILNGLVGKDLNQKLELVGIKVLGYYGTGARSIYSKKPVKQLEDLRGLKLRVMESNVMIQTINALGSHAVPLSFSELYNALQQEVVDGAENNSIQYLATGHYDICPYYILTEHFIVPQVIVMPLSFYNQLSHTHKKILEEVFTESQAFHKDHWESIKIRTLDKLQKEGVKITEVDKKPFRNQVKQVYDEFEVKYGNNLLHRIRTFKD